MNIWLIAFFVALPFERIPTAELFGITVRISSLIVLSGILIWGIKFTREPSLKMNRLDWLGLAVWGMALLSLPFADNARRGITVLLLGLYVWASYYIISRIIIRLGKRGWEIAVLSLLVVSTAVSVFGLIQFIGNSLGWSARATLLLEAYSKSVLGFPRVQSVAMEPLYFANFLLLPLFIIISGIVIGRWRSLPLIRQIPLWIALFIQLVAFVLTVSRGAYVAFAFGILVMAALMVIYKRNLLYWPGILGVIAVGFLSGYVSMRLVYWSVGAQGTANLVEHVSVHNKTGALIVSVQNSLNISDSTKKLEPTQEETEVAGVDSRVVQMREAWRLFRENPVFGVGIGNFGVVSQAPKEVGAGNFQTVNNEYLEWLAEVGAIGFTVFLAWVLMIVRTLLVLFQKESDSQTLWLVVGLGATFAAILIQYNFFSTLYILYIWTVIAMVRALMQTK